MNKFIKLSWFVWSALIPLFYMLLILVSAFGIVSGFLNLVLLIGYGIVWYYVYKIVGDNYVRKGGRK